MAARKMHILTYTREVYKSFHKNEDGKLELNTNSVLEGRNLKEKQLNFLKSYIEFIMSSGLISEVTYIWFNSIESDQNEAIRTHNKMVGGNEQISYKKATNHFYNDGKRLLKYFPDDMILNIYYHRGNGIDEYEKLLENAIALRLGNTELRKMSILSLPVTVNKERPTDDKIDEFFMSFSAYTKERVKMVQSQLPRSVIGYLNYLSSKANLDDEEQVIIDRLERLNQPVSEFSDDDYEIE